MPKVIAEGKTIELGIGDWGLGTRDWGLGRFRWGFRPQPNLTHILLPSPQSPVPSPQSLSEQESNLRKILLQNSIDLYNGGAKVINCRGIGSCGTCTVKVEGKVSAANWRDRSRRSLPPHSPTTDLRLACQTQVLGDVEVTKFDGFWGQGSRIVWTPKG